MKVIYDKKTGTLLDATHVLIGDIDPMEQVTDEEMITEVLAQDRPLYEFENEKAAETQKARSYLHCWALTPEETQVLREAETAETAKDIESKKGCREPEVSQEQFLVWICYITDNYGNPLVVKVVPTKKKALEWLSDAPHAMGKKDDDEVRGLRFVDRFVVEAE